MNLHLLYCLVLQEALEHPWFGILQTAEAGLQTIQHLKGSLERFINMNKLKRAALEVIAEQLTEAELIGLRATFERLDTNHDGKLTYAELTNALQVQGFEGLTGELGRIMEGMGLDDSNEIVFSEFLAATMDMNYAIRDENIMKAFQQFDKDGSGACISCVVVVMRCDSMISL